MRRYALDKCDEIVLAVDETIELESLRLPVVPPYVLVIPVAEEPDNVEIVSQESFGGEGVHASLYTIRGAHAGEGLFRFKYRDLRSGDTVAEKTIRVQVT